MLSIAHCYPQLYTTLLQRIAGAVLLGCPHSRSDSAETWKAIISIMRVYADVKLPKGDTISRQVARGLREDCSSFEQTFYNIPVLTIYETQKIRVPGLVGSKAVASLAACLFRTIWLILQSWSTKHLQRRMSNKKSFLSLPQIMEIFIFLGLGRLLRLRLSSIDRSKRCDCLCSSILAEVCSTF